MMDKFKNFLIDLCSYLKEDALDAKKDRDGHKDTKDKDFYSGRLLAYYEIIDTIKDLLIGFQIDPKEVKMDDITPDKDLV